MFPVSVATPQDWRSNSSLSIDLRPTGCRGINHLKATVLLAGRTNFAGVANSAEVKMAVQLFSINPHHVWKGPIVRAILVQCNANETHRASALEELHIPFNSPQTHDQGTGNPNGQGQAQSSARKKQVLSFEFQGQFHANPLTPSMTLSTSSFDV
jgi:hypothetical protein